MFSAVIGVPYNSAGPRSGVASAPRALADAGLVTSDALELIDLPPGVAERGPSGLLAEQLLVEMIVKVEAAVGGAMRAGRRPLVLGGDCPVLLGALAAGREQFGRMGVLFVDGHEDAWDPRRSPTGEAADSELGLALGRYRTGLPGQLLDRLPLLDPTDVAILGARDAGELAANGQPSLAGTVELRDPDRLRDDGFADSARQAVGSIRGAFPGESPWWLHVDLDVLATDQLSAVDYPQDGGLTWVELTTLVGTALAEPDCRGLTLCIYNPDLDPDRDEANKIVDFVADIAKFLA